MSATSIIAETDQETWVPDYQEFMAPVIQCCSDGQVHSVKSLEEVASQILGLTDEQRSVLIKSGKRTKAKSRANWAAYYLKRAGCLNAVKKGHYQITDRGMEVYQSKEPLSTEYLMRFPEFLEFLHKNKSDEPAVSKASASSPIEVISEAHLEITEALADELLETIKDVSPKGFESLVLDVLSAMGYGGGLKRRLQVTQYSKDQGIDGIINEDALGLNQVCIQAKRYTNGTVGRPEIQSFAGSMDGHGTKKGVFITTSTFTKDAVEYAIGLREKRIILIDGKTLAQHMIDHGVGVSEENRFIVYRIDSDYFDAFE